MLQKFNAMDINDLKKGFAIKLPIVFKKIKKIYFDVKFHYTLKLDNYQEKMHLASCLDL